LVFEGAFEDEEVLEVFLGKDGAYQTSPILFLANVEIDRK